MSTDRMNARESNRRSFLSRVAGVSALALPALALSRPRAAMAAVDVESLAGAAPGAREPLGAVQVEELPATRLFVHPVDDREVHGIGSGR